MIIILTFWFCFVKEIKKIVAWLQYKMTFLVIQKNIFQMLHWRFDRIMCFVSVTEVSGFYFKIARDEVCECYLIFYFFKIFDQRFWCHLLFFGVNITFNFHLKIIWNLFCCLPFVDFKREYWITNATKCSNLMEFFSILCLISGLKYLSSKWIE